ncbi:hypothetical protein LBMAG53_14920 [Planctomycetota bacterium]|nr:hypothetical protein LBMAG53_14920 [Planctomycetota bacterium]
MITAATLDDGMTTDLRTRFLSVEDLDLTTLSDSDFMALSAAALREQQKTNDADRHIYHHGCIAVEPGYEHLLPLIRSGLL